MYARIRFLERSPLLYASIMLFFVVRYVLTPPGGTSPLTARPSIYFDRSSFAASSFGFGGGGEYTITSGLLTFDGKIRVIILSEKYPQINKRI